MKTCDKKQIIDYVAKIKYKLHSQHCTVIKCKNIKNLLLFLKTAGKKFFLSQYVINWEFILRSH